MYFDLQNPNRKFIFVAWHWKNPKNSEKKNVYRNNSLLKWAKYETPGFLGGIRRISTIQKKRTKLLRESTTYENVGKNR